MTDTMTLDEYHKQVKPSRSKFGNKKVRADGYVFDSKAEYERYCQLKLLQRDGAISKLTVHPKFILMESFRDRSGNHHRAITYKPDFEYFERDHHVVEDVKGGRATQTEAFRMRVKLLLKRYPDVEFRTVT